SGGVGTGCGASSGGAASPRFVDTVNHVERSPSRLSNSPPLTTRVAFGQRALTSDTRPEAFATSERSGTHARPSFRATVRAGTTTGPHGWCGESASYGSATERRYGTAGARGSPSFAAAVRPPEAEK